MRTVIAQIYDYSLDGISAEEGSSFFDFCRALPDDPACLDRAVDFYRNADLIVMGRTHYQGAAAYFPSADDDPYADVMNAGRKVVFSRTLAAADWANTTVTSSPTAALACCGRSSAMTWLTNSGYIWSPTWRARAHGSSTTSSRRPS